MNEALGLSMRALLFDFGELSLPLKMLENHLRRFIAHERLMLFIDSGENLSYNHEVVFEWDENKAKSNLRKHKIGFDEAESVFNDPFVVTFFDEFHSLEEERLISIGISNVNRVLLIVHTEVSSDINAILVRIISCRKATVLEREIYEEQF
jgi:uncharacterized DUF497 family protein